MANEFIVRNGLIAKASSIISGSLEITGAVTGSGAGLTNIPSAGLTPPGSDTQILFNSDGSLAANSGLVYSGSRLGIGTTSPAAPLAISNGGAEGIELNYNVGNEARIISYNRSNSTYRNLVLDSAFLRFKISGTEKFIINGSGNVGIGEASPSAKLHVSGTSDVLLVEGSGSTIFDVQGSQGQLFSVTDSLVGSLFSVNDISGLPIIEVFDTDKVVMGTFGQNTLVVTGSLVGIGTGTPNRPLTIETNTTDVVGALKVKNAGTGDASMFFQVNASGNVWQLGIDNSDGDKFKIGQDNSNADVGVGTKLTIDTSGNVGIGTASPSQKLHVDGNALVNNLYLSNTTTRLSTNGSGEVGIDYNNSATSTYGLSVYNGSTTRVFGVKRATGDVEMNGDLTVSGIVTAQEFHTEFVSASIIYQSGSTQFGNSYDDSHIFTGSFTIDGGTTGNTAKLTIAGNDSIIKLGSNLQGGPHGLQFDYEGGKGDGMSMYYRTSPQQIVFEDSTGTSGTAVMAISRSGDVGIGTTSPAYKLHVLGDFGVKDGSSAIAFNEYGGGAVIWMDGANGDFTGGDYFNIWTPNETRTSIGFSGSEILSVTSGSRVGIGNTAPAYKLDVSGTSRIAGTIHMYGAVRNYSGDFSLQNGVQDSDILFKVNDGGTTVTAMMVDGATSRVGIGTTSPGAKLDISAGSNDGIRIAANNAFLGSTTAGDTQLIYWNGDHAYYGRNPGGAGIVRSHSFRTEGNTKMFITGSSVGINTQTPRTSLHVVGASILATNTAIDLDDTTGVIAGALQDGGGWSVDSGIGGRAAGTGDTWAIGHNGSALYLGIGDGVSTNSLETWLQVDPNLSASFAGNVQTDENFTLVATNTYGARYRTYSPTDKNWGLSTFASHPEYHTVIHGYGSGSNARQFRVYDHAGSATRFAVNFDDGNVGIGTTNPSYKLEVAGHVSASAFSGSFKGDGSGLTDVTAVISLAEVLGTGNDAGGNDIENVGALTAGAITATSEVSGSTIRSANNAYFGGNVGIGTTSPGEKLHVKGDVRAESGANTSGTVRNKGYLLWSDDAFGMQLHHDGSSWGTAVFARSYDSDVRLGHYNASVSGQNEFTSSLVVKYTGNVGIGTTSIPTAKLQVAGIISGSKLDLPRGGYITFYGDDDGTGDHSISARDANGNASDDLRINSFHNVYVNLDSNNNNSSNTTSFSISQHGGTGTLGSSLFSVRGDGLTTVTGDLTVTGALNATASYATTVVNIPSLAEVLNSGEDGGGFNILDIASIEASGTVTAGTFVETSARRFKENIEPISNSLEILSKIDGITFNRIGEERREYGFIADDILDVAPELVSHDENGEVHGVHYARTVAILTEAVKELDNKVKAQDLFIKDLVARIEKLENK